MNTNLKVKIFQHTKDLERVCAAAALMSTTPGTCTDVYEGIGDTQKASRILSRIVKLGHVSILEHASFNIMFENVSLFFEQYLIEHRLSAYTIKSGRYVDFRGVGCYEPEFRFENEVSAETKEMVKEKYKGFVEETFSIYENYADSGIKVEDARFILPYALKTNIYCTMNGREIIHLIYSMLNGRGKKYPELVEIATMLKEELESISPCIASNIENVEKGDENKEIMINDLLGKAEFNKEIDWSKKPLIEILDCPDNIEETIVVNAIIKNRQLSKQEAKELIKNDPKLKEQIIDIIFNDKRKRELESVNITFRMNDMPLILLKHQVRHRIQSINVPSFTEMARTNRYTIPHSIIEKGKEYEKTAIDCYEKSSNLYKEFRDLGVREEDLAYIFMHGKNLDVVTTMNLRNVFHIMNLRTCNRAQWKMREYYKELLNQLLGKTPDVFKYFGANCYTKGYCPEGKMTCGKITEVKSSFAKAIEDILGN